MTEEVLRAVAVVVALGVGSLLVAEWLRLPALLVLLPAGILGGPVLGLVDPQRDFGALLFPSVALGVGLLLFEGGLQLRWTGLAGRSVVVRLVTVGAACSLAVGAAVSVPLFGVDRGLATLIGAVLVVSGPTVVLPLLDSIRVDRELDSVLRWEGIVIDPLGATVAIVVLEAVLGGGGVAEAARGVLVTVAAGAAVGLAFTGVLVLGLRRHLLPDHLQIPVALAAVVAALALANGVRPEAGLVATTVFGVALANQRWAPVGHIADFHGALGALVLAVLFIVLGATVDLGELWSVAPRALVLTAALVLVARPAGVVLSTVGSGLRREQRAFLACVAPRGIVAAAVAALFALQLPDAGIDPGPLVPATFIVVLATAVLYGLGAPVAARRLGVLRPDPRGVVIIGGQPWALDLGRTLRRDEVPVLVATPDPYEAYRARTLGLDVYEGRLDATDLHEECDRLGVRQAIAVSEGEERNALGVANLAGHLGRANVFAIPAAPGREEPDEAGGDQAVRARPAFDDSVASGAEIEAWYGAGGRFVTLAEGESPRAGDVPVVVIDGHGRATFVERSAETGPGAGRRLLVMREGEAGPASAGG